MTPVSIGNQDKNMNMITRIHALSPSPPITHFSAVVYIKGQNYEQTFVFHLDKTGNGIPMVQN